MSISNLSKIAAAEKLEHKLHYAWLFLTESGIEYNPLDSYSRTPIAISHLIWAHGRYGKRTEAIKKIDAIHLVCMFLSCKAGEA